MGNKLKPDRVLTRPRPPHNANLLLGFDGEGHFLQDQRQIFLVSHLCVLKGHLSFLGPVRRGSLVLNSGRCFQRESLGRQKWPGQTGPDSGGFVTEKLNQDNHSCHTGAVVAWAPCCERSLGSKCLGRDRAP